MITPVKVQADELRWEVGQSRETTKPTKSNHAKEESLAIKSLQSDTSISKLPNDKSNATVVMNKFEYPEKLECLVRDGNFIKVKKWIPP